MHRGAGLALVGCPAHVELRVPRTGTARAFERFDQLPVGGGTPVAVADTAGELRGFGAEARHDDRDWALRRVEQPSVLDFVELAVVVNRRSGEELPDDADGFFEHQPANRGPR